MFILAVDDDPFILELLSEIIDHIGGHTLVTAASGSKALDILHDDDSFDCIMLDIQMPDMDGIEVCRALRQIPGYEVAPVLMLTAMSEKSYIDSAFLAGATDYLNKPFEITELRVRLGVLEELVAARTRQGATLVATPSGARTVTSDHPMSIYRPFEIHDIAGIVDAVALENYVAKLSRARLFGSSVFAVSVRRVEQLFHQMSPFDFQCMIVDVAEALADTMAAHAFIGAYAGNGTFVCVVEGARLPDFERFTDQLNLAIHRLEMHSSKGARLHVRVSTGNAMRIMWRSGATALDALSQAVTAAEAEAQRAERDLDDFWYLGASA
ncbi:Response regulator receiver domain-containing protein [Loktanella fryxellensis]|uniref:Response regulator receiver domain-containing protein n=1 Tax=Loktanella fryxellensis TaxID=245187 RepID=A0A1H8ECH8_9RHOB|nr:response regulator [Loktanella fryxellensis]SEN17185.1 Response regulator receiver domain-containing protein [Loktanella fryxellensis]